MTICVMRFMRDRIHVSTKPIFPFFDNHTFSSSRGTMLFINRPVKVAYMQKRNTYLPCISLTFSMNLFILTDSCSHQAVIPKSIKSQSLNTFGSTTATRTDQLHHMSKMPLNESTLQSFLYFLFRNNR